MIEFNNSLNFDLPIEELKELAERVYDGEKDISVAFLSSEDIAKHNEEYKDRRGPTDVLSFPGDFFLGEVLIAPEVVKAQAEKHGLEFDREIRRVLVHGILHLLGYDHKKEEEKKKMRKKEEEFLNG